MKCSAHPASSSRSKPIGCRSPPGQVPAHWLGTHTHPEITARCPPRAYENHRAVALLQGEIADYPDRFIDAALPTDPNSPPTQPFAAATTSNAPRQADSPRRSAVPTDAVPPSSKATSTHSSNATCRRSLPSNERRNCEKLLQLLAIRSANLLVATTMANELDIHRMTITRYLTLLETVFLIKTIPAWSGGGTHRAIGTPKLSFVDTGLLCHLLGQGPGRLADPGGAAGPVLENFVLMELARQLTWNDERVTLWHYRTKDKVAVDAVLEAADGRIIGIEVKAARRFTSTTSPDFATSKTDSAIDSSPGSSSIPDNTHYRSATGTLLAAAMPRPVLATPPPSHPRCGQYRLQRRICGYLRRHWTRARAGGTTCSAAHPPRHG